VAIDAHVNSVANSISHGSHEGSHLVEFAKTKSAVHNILLRFIRGVVVVELDGLEPIRNTLLRPCCPGFQRIRPIPSAANVSV
tara:strand:- start:692 stop:940 length:249 start_codon:yes stop_codon:yes gene_type:complete